MSEAALRVEKLQVNFGPVEAVRTVSFQVAPGACFGIVGESGSGKSTILRAICGLIRDWRGEIRVQGTPPRYDRAFFRQVQMVFQDPYGSLHPRHTVNAVLAEPLKIHGIQDRGRRIEAILEQVGLDHSFRYRYPHQLSGGQRQRVAIARALILESSVLLLDEPTSALDVSVQAEILNLLARLRAEHHLTYLLVTHNLAVVSHLCEGLLVMNAGRVVEELDIQQLRRHQTRDPYTRQLLTASLGYDREAAASLQTFD